MGGLFSKPSSPPPPAPVPEPPLIEDQEEVEDFATRQARKRKGFRSTLVTGDVTPATGKKSVLG